ncbi:nitrite/sulfite reductase [Desulfurispirillum indicum]|uniref:nitrite/sulfite reductase n=1 Tax=Desulfurispirillum indicum TaxID=936456 RepID=UPI001CFC0487|nr:nitrite/sulfite reductase [Desulfurispirillum indicum]UCZ57465.1 nitrite/sulfite reductase [Desulfurispirillum indicum]
MEKETKAQRVERLKREKDGLDIMDDIRHYCQSGEPVDADTIDRLKWYGMYTHNQHSSPEGRQFFMMRVKVPTGNLTIEQVETIAGISREFARNTADITVRQTIQLHWIEFANVCTVLDRLQAAGLTTQNASGDCPRSIVTCPVAGHAHDELLDVSGIVREVDRYFQGNHEFSNLPRKFKMGISACGRFCTGHEVQDLSFAAHQLQGGRVAFGVHVGGGLGSNQRFATNLGSVDAQQILPVAIACAALFREEGKRDNRGRARLGHLLEDMGADAFRQALQDRSGVEFLPATSPALPDPRQRQHVGIEDAKETGYQHIGTAIVSGRITGEGLATVARIAREAGAATIAFTGWQNLILTRVPRQHVARATQQLEAAGLSVADHSLSARAIACTGLEFCKFAISETKERQAQLIKALQARFPDFKEPLSISLSGCPNGCSHPNVVDLGFVGWKVKVDGELKEGFVLHYGGRLQGDGSRFAVRTNEKIDADQLSEFVIDLIEKYRASEKPSLPDYLQEVYS